MGDEGIHVGVVAAALAGDIRQAPRVSREMGFNGLQFDAASDALDLMALSASGRREFRRLLSAQEQQLVGLRFDLGAKGFGPGADVDRLLARLGLVMDAAAGLSAPLVCLDVGPLPPVPRTPVRKAKVTSEQAGLILLPEMAITEPPAPAEPDEPADPAFVGQVNAAMAELGRKADRYSVILALRSDLASFASMEQVLRQANCQWFGVDLDPVSVLRDEWDLDEVFSRLGPLVRHVRGRDAISGPERRTKPAVIGQGSVNWQALLADLDAADYAGWITIDPVDLPDRLAGAAAGLKFLRSIPV